MTMKARINTYAFSQTLINSAGLGVLGTIAHPMNDEGDYVGTVLRQGREVGSFQLKVDSEIDDEQVNIDLASISTERTSQNRRFGEPNFEVASKGFMVLYVSEGPGDYHVLLSKLSIGRRAATRPRRVFDSRALQDEDVFIASLLRPGRYEMTDGGRGKGRIIVAYPTPGKKAFIPPAHAVVNVTSKGLDPAELGIRPAQGVVFNIHTTKAAIQVKLAEADDGPRDKGVTRDKVRWTNPANATAAKPSTPTEKKPGTVTRRSPTRAQQLRRSIRRR